MKWFINLSSFRYVQFRIWNPGAAQKSNSTHIPMTTTQWTLCLAFFTWHIFKIHSHWSYFNYSHSTVSVLHFHCMNRLHLTYPLISWLLFGLFPLWVIINSPALNYLCKNVCVFSILFCIYLGVDLPGQRITISIFLRNDQIVFHNRCMILHSLQVFKGSNFPTSSPHLLPAFLNPS